MKTRTLTRLVAAAFIAGATGLASAADISMVQGSATNVTLDRSGNAVVRFNVSGSANSNDHCGYFVEYGDGAAGDSRVIERENGQFSRAHERTFTKPGTYTIKASGRMVKTTAPCAGAATTQLTVVAGNYGAKPTQTSQAQTQAKPTCPEGWALNEKSVNWRTGAFTCSAKPAVAFECPQGLRYFERDGVIGCRQRGEGRRS
jgi:hypothetical protein